MLCGLKSKKGNKSIMEKIVDSMTATGIVRKIDELGRIVIPVELRKTLEIGLKDPVEIFTSRNLIILRKYLPECIFCNDLADTSFMGKKICLHCLEKIKTET